MRPLRFKQKELNEHDKEFVSWIQARDWTYLGDATFSEDDCETEDGYNFVHSTFTKWYHKEEANIGEL